MPIANHHRLLLSHIAHLSTTRDTKSGQTPLHKPGPGAPQPQNPPYPAFSFRDLGASRKVKFFVIACVAVVGTIESVFWVKVAWAKLGPSPEKGRS
jgi:hypothetical protein